MTVRVLLKQLYLVYEQIGNVTGVMSMVNGKHAKKITHRCPRGSSFFLTTREKYFFSVFDSGSPLNFFRTPMTSSVFGQGEIRQGAFLWRNYRWVQAIRRFC